MKQQLIMARSAENFDIRVNQLLREDWYFVPGTFIANMSHDGHTERFTMLLIKDEDHDEIVATVKQQMALEGCNSQCGAHDGHMPPPFFQSPDEEPTTDDGLTDKQ
jgi:hypothetical protein